MATKPYSMKTISSSLKMVTWTDLDGTDDGTPFYVGDCEEVTVQHTTGAGTIAMEGSNDAGTTWSPLDDKHGDAVATLAADAFATIDGVPSLIRPVVTGGTNDVVVMLCARGD